MSNQKRRVIYMTDQEWSDLEQRSKKEGVSASAYIRGAIAVSGGVTFVKPDIDAAFAAYRPAPKPSARKGKS